MSYILGIDQGGTKTYAAIMGSDGNILSARRTVGCYFREKDIGLDKAADIIFAAADEAMRDAGISTDDIGVVVAGITGIDFEGDDDMVGAVLAKRYTNKTLIVSNDCEIAYFGGSVKPVGAVLCAGTGINAAFFAPDGRTFVMGDYLKSDLQGGGAISQRAIEAVFDADLGALPETGLTKLFLSLSNETRVPDLLKRYMTDEDFSRQIISLVPQIVACAEDGDEVTLNLLSSFSDELVARFIAAMDKMDMRESNCDIVLTGGVFEGAENCLTAMIIERLSQCAENANIIKAAFAPVAGACVRGHLRNNGQYDEPFVRNLTESSKEFGLLR